MAVPSLRLPEVIAGRNTKSSHPDRLITLRTAYNWAKNTYRNSQRPHYKMELSSQAKK